MSKDLHWAERPFLLVPTPKPQGEKPDKFEKAAIEMALVHNLILRGLNSIYNQAPWVKPEDTRDFLEYCKLWAEIVTVHHGAEERNFFPWIEQATGVPGLMQTNVAQHSAFHDGLHAMEDYVTTSLQADGGASFDGKKVVELIDGFGPPLRDHLFDEIGTLIALQEHADKMDGFTAMLNREAQENMASIGKTTGLVLLLLLHDKSWEDYKWTNFPPAPAVVMFIVRKLVFHLHSNLWRFAPCDNNALPKAQYAAPPSKA